MNYFISDTHFGHYNVINYSNRPLTLSSDESIPLPQRQKQLVQQMNEMMIQRWNSVVTDQDTVYFVGDFAFLGIKQMQEICHKLKGRKVLIKGNHDRSAKQMREVGFSEVHDTLELKIGDYDCILNHYPYVDVELQEIAKRRPNMIKTHENAKAVEIPTNLDYNQMKEWLAKTLQFAIKTPDKDTMIALQRLLSKYIGTRLVNEGKILIHGHTHFNRKRFANMINCSVEAWDFTPFSEEEVIKLIKEYEGEILGEGLSSDNYQSPVYEYYRSLRKTTPELKKMLPVVDLVHTYERYAYSQETNQKFKTGSPSQNYSEKWYELNKQLNGFIPQADLEDGEYYLGYCRNAEWSYWDGAKQKFYYIRSKFGNEFIEEIECMENDNGFDVFVPYEKYVPSEQERAEFEEMYARYCSRG